MFDRLAIGAWIPRSLWLYLLVGKACRWHCNVYGNNLDLFRSSLEI